MEIDFLTVTTDDDGVGRRLFFLVTRDTATPPRYRWFMRAEGYQFGKLFVGRWSNGRWLASVAGEQSGQVWRLLLDEAVDPRLISVARVDIQTTLHTVDADKVIGKLEPSLRYKGTRISQTTGRGSTLYVGAAKSDKRLRIYNKSAQAGIDVGIGELLRVELQLRNSHADLALAIARANDEGGFYRWWRETCCAMAPDLSGILPLADTAHIQIPEKQDEEPGYRAWIERCVLPALEKARLTPEWEGIKASLLTVIREDLPDAD